jgi:hypothetical protein
MAPPRNRLRPCRDLAIQHPHQETTGRHGIEVLPGAPKPIQIRSTRELLVRLDQDLCKG